LSESELLRAMFGGAGAPCRERCRRRGPSIALRMVLSMEEISYQPELIAKRHCPPPD
jgi:hypothetical protein